MFYLISRMRETIDHCLESYINTSPNHGYCINIKISLYKINIAFKETMDFMRC